MNQKWLEGLIRGMRSVRADYVPANEELARYHERRLDVIENAESGEEMAIKELLCAPQQFHKEEPENGTTDGQ